MHRLMLPLAVLLALAVAAPGQAQKAREAATPEEAVKNLAEAARAGDVDAVFAQMIKPQREFKQVVLEQDRAQRALEAALDEKFGKEPGARPRPTLKEQMATLQTLEIVEKTDAGKGKVLLKVKQTIKRAGKERTRETRMLAVKEGDAWKVGFLDRRPKEGMDPLKEIEREMAQERERAQRRTAAAEKVIKEIKAGKYKTRGEARRAFFEAASPRPPRKDAPRDKKPDR